jgi:FtsH-binding integral membrane protein
VKGNRPLRFFAVAMATLVIVAHLVGQVDLSEDWLFWILLAVSLVMHQVARQKTKTRKPAKGFLLSSLLKV